MSNKLLSIASRYDNPYEAAYNIARADKMFKQEDWNTFAKRGELDRYLSVLSETDKLPVDFDKKQNFDLLNTDLRFQAMSNELWSDRNELKTREEMTFNEQTQKEEKRTFEMTDYEYISSLLEQRVSFEQEKIIRKQNQERKDSMNPFLKFLGSAVSVAVVEPVQAIAEIVQDLVSLTEGVVDGFTTLADGGMFEDGFRAAFDTSATGGSDWRAYDNLGMKDALLEFEKNYSDIRDLDGNYTTIGKYLGGVTYSLGKALPMIGLNLISAGTVGAGTAAATNMAKAATGLYFTGLGVGEFRSMASNPAFASVPTIELVANASVRTLTEFLITKGVSKAFGPTQLDKLMYGQTTKAVGSITAKSAVTRIAKDFLAEGTEEFLQQYSNYIVDGFFAIGRQEFAQNSEWNLQTAFDAFIIGGLSTIGGNLMSVNKSVMKDLSNHKAIKAIEKKIKNGTATDANLEQLAELKDKPKLNLLASWQFKNTLNDLTGEYTKLMKNKSLSTEERQQALGQMYATTRTIADVYGEIGEARFLAAQKMLQKLDVKEKSEVKGMVLMAQVKGMQTDYSKKQMTKVGMTEVVATFKKEQSLDEALAEIPDDVKDQVRSTIENLRKTDPTKDIVITKDGTDVLSIEGTEIIPLNYAVSDDGTDITKRFAEKNLVKSVLESPKIMEILGPIKEMFEKISNRQDVDMEEVIYNLFFNDSFFRIVLTTSNRTVYQLLSRLDMIEKSVNAKTERDAIYKKKIAEAKKNMAIALTQYLILQQNANYNDLTILNQNQRDFIRKHRWGKDLANRVINGDKLSTDDINLLKMRVNGMSVSAQVKLDIMAGLGFDKDWQKIQSTEITRRAKMTQINKEYRNQFLSPYDGVTYLKDDNLNNNVFNDMLFTLGLDLHNFLDINLVDADGQQYIIDTYGFFDSESLLEYRRDTFKEMTGGGLSFEMIGDKVTISGSVSNEAKGYENYNRDRDKVLTGQKLGLTEERTAINVVDGRGRLDSLIGRGVDAATRGYLTITDLINEPQLMTKTIQENLPENPSPQATFLYLREKMLDDTGTISIVVRADGTYTFVDIKPMMETLKHGKIEPKDVGDGKIENLVDKAFLPEGSRLADIIVEIGGDSTFYNPRTNTINIAKDATGDYFRFAFLHEFAHAIQTENNLNGGLNSDWLLKDGNNNGIFISKIPGQAKHVGKISLDPNTVARRLADDIRAHKPKLLPLVILKGSEKEFIIVQQFVYDTSGESQANGTEGSEIVDFYPTIVREDGENTLLTLPWGTQYKIDSVNGLTNMSLESKTEIKSLEQPSPGRTRITKTKTEKNPLMKAFKGKLLPIEIQGLLNSKPDLAQMDEQLLEHIYQGTLNLQTVNNLIRDVNAPINDYTFKLLNEFVYKNEYITSVDQLQKLTDIDAGNYWATREILRSQKAESLLTDPRGFIEFMKMMEALDRNSSLRLLFDTLKVRFYYTGDESLDINVGNMRVAFMKLFDGTIETAGALAKHARTAALMGSGSTTDVKTTRGGLDDAVNVGAKNNTEDEVMVNMLNNLTRERKEEMIVRYRVDNYKTKHPDLTQKQTMLLMSKTYDQLVEVTEDSIDQFLVEHVLAEIDNRPENFTQEINDNVKSTVRKLESIQLNIKRLARNVNRDMSKSDWKKIPAEFRDLFDENFKLKQSTYDTRNLLDHEATKRAEEGKNVYSQVGVSREKLLELENILRQMAREARQGVYRTKTSAAIMKQLEKERAKYKKEHAKRLLVEGKKTPKVVEKTIVLNSHEFEVSSDVEMPQLLRKILSDSLDGFSKTEVQFLTGANELKRSIERTVKESKGRIDLNEADIKILVSRLVDSTIKTQTITETDFLKVKTDNRFSSLTIKDLKNIYFYYQSNILEKIENGDKHTQMNMKNFLLMNAERLSAMNQGEVDALLEFYAKSSVMSFGKLGPDDIRKYEAFQIYILSFILSQNQQGQWNLTTEQLKNITEKLRLMADMAGTNLAVWRESMRLIDPNKVLLKSIERSSGITLREDDLDEMSRAMDKGDLKEVMRLQEQMTRNALIDNRVGLKGALTLVDDRIKQAKEQKEIGLLNVERERILVDIQEQEAHVTELKNKLSKDKKNKGLKLELQIAETILSGISKQSIWNKLWRFQRLAMLSGPGTWVRNHTSNALVTAGNNAADFLGNLFVKKERRQGQYKLVGTEVSKSTKDFIESRLFESGFVDNVLDGLSKYDVRKSKSRTSGTDIAIDMLARAVENRVLNQVRYSKNEKLNKGIGMIPKFIMKMLSDDVWIKNRMKKYLGKMLTEDGVSLNKGISREVLETLANAFTAAGFDYMRKPNTFTKVEGQVRAYGGELALLAYKQVFPFASASWNWFVEGLRYTPLGLAKAIYNFAKLENTIDKMEESRMKGDQVISSRMAEYLTRRDIGKGIIGSIGLLIGMLLGLTGGAGIDEEDDKLKLRVGDVSVDISSLFGSQSILLGIVLTNPRGRLDQDKEIDWAMYLRDVATTLAEDSIISDLFNTFRFNQDVGQYILDQPNRMLGMFVPNFLKTVTSLSYNHNVQYSKGMLGRFERTFVQSIPGLAYAMPKKYDPYTGQLQSRFRMPLVIDAINRLTPIKLYDTKMSDVEKEAVAQGVRKGELTGAYEDIGNLSPKDITKINNKYGELNTESLKELQSDNLKRTVQMPDGTYKSLTYSQMSTDQKKRATERIMSNNALYAKVFIFTENGGKYYAGPAEYKILRQLGISVYRETSKLSGFASV